MSLPFLAFKLLLTRPKLLLLSFFPGAFTFAVSAVVVYGVWSATLTGITLWVSLPTMMLTFFVAWLIFGNLSLIFIEDTLIDQVQIARWGSVKIAAPPFSMNRILREAVFSVFVAGVAILLFLLSFVAFLAPLNFVFAAWLTAYGFLAAAYARKTSTARERFRLLMHDWFPNFLLGAFLNILLFVPIVNVFLLGYAQILAGLVFVERESVRSGL